MRILVPGAHPRAVQLAELLQTAGHEVVTAAETADVVLCCQADDNDGPVYRHQLLELLSALGSQLRAPCLVCLVSLEPNLVWPAGFCHTACTTLRFSGTAERFPVTRAHLQSLTLPTPADLILGADADADKKALRTIWQGLFESQDPLPIGGIFEAELAAEYKPQNVRQA